MAALVSVPLVSLLCCVPGFAVIGAMDASCGAGFDHECMDLAEPVFTVWPWVTGGVAAAALLTLLAIPRRAEGLRLLAGAVVVVPPIVNALVAFAQLSRTGPA
ncbi:hypothetical protein L3i22_043960 [Actinoplanes sp. L3-i22]|nr:hypothetical protein L3i22_043960 [Actinoplanes sp. L3-i22]